MVAPGVDGRRAKGPVVVTAYLPHDAEGVLMERERKRKRERYKKRKERYSPEKVGEKNEAR